MTIPNRALDRMTELLLKEVQLQAIADAWTDCNEEQTAASMVASHRILNALLDALTEDNSLAPIEGVTLDEGDRLHAAITENNDD